MTDCLLVSFTAKRNCFTDFNVCHVDSLIFEESRRLHVNIDNSDSATAISY